MTRNRVPYRGLGLIAAAVASVMSPNVFSQPGRATLINPPNATQQYCDYTSIETKFDGQVNITCGAVVPLSPGTLAFSSSVFAPVAKDAATASVPVNVVVNRAGGITGPASATLGATSPCSPLTQTVSYSDGLGGPKTVALTANAVGTCNLTLTAATGAVLGTITASTVDVTLPPPSGGAIIPGCEGKTPTSNFTQHTGFFGLAGSPVTFTDVGNGRIHSWALPKTATGAQVQSGIIVHTATPNTPGTLKIEWSISKCPGDTAYFSAPEAAITMRGVVYHPCGSETGWESGGVKWNAAGGSAQCKVPTTETWYVNMRYTQGCSGSCPVYFSWQLN
jgi:hypothetical protein